MSVGSGSHSENSRPRGRLSVTAQEIQAAMDRMAGEINYSPGRCQSDCVQGVMNGGLVIAGQLVTRLISRRWCYLQPRATATSYPPGSCSKSAGGAFTGRAHGLLNR